MTVMTPSLEYPDSVVEEIRSEVGSISYIRQNGVNLKRPTYAREDLPQLLRLCRIEQYMRLFLVIFFYTEIIQTLDRIFPWIESYFPHLGSVIAATAFSQVRNDTLISQKFG